MEANMSLLVYFDSEVILYITEGVKFICRSPISFTISCTQPVLFFDGVIQIQLMNVIDEATMLEMLMIYIQNQTHVPILELYVEFKQLENSHKADESLLNWEENNSDSEEEFLANNDMFGGSDRGNNYTDKEVHASINTVASQYSFDVPSFMRDLDAMLAPKFAEFANPSVPFVQDSKFVVGMEFGSREAVVMTIRRYTLLKGVYESEPLTFYAKCLQYGKGCDWLIRASLI
ncbi:hypothetical protein Ahy_B07g087744 [Arachis hypogaea]|uniref:Transposase MuDR plant domain-containing protein n=1 Tax=Arachis hypogaea TaxID=3818 RepID=A0A444YCW1_ARAHY|nr:hypothetical protein Ahy_B07g087744 [Arachis hypogaea]